MQASLTLKDPLKEARLFRARTAVALGGTFLLVLGLVGRLFFLQVTNHEHFTTLSRDNRVKIVAMPPTRGLIYDRNGVLLAENLPSFSLEVVPEQIEDMHSTLEELGKLVDISPADTERFLKLVSRRRRFESVPLRFRLSEEEVARFAVNRARFPGVEIEARLARYYPLGEHTAHAVGYVGRINEWELQHLDSANYSGSSHVGKVGVEHSYEDILHGRVGYQQVETNAQGRVLRVLERTLPVPGQDLYLHLDSRLQSAAEAALGDYNGAVVAIDTTDGGVLALVSKPGYDPNPFVNGIDSRAYQELQTSKSRPLFNRALRGQYPPGSTIKPFVALAGLEYGVVTPNKGTYCPGWYTLSGDKHKYRCWRRTGHGHVQMRRAIVESCDVYFYDLALTLGIDRLHTYLGKFGFGHKTGIDISGEREGLMPSREWKRAARNQAWYPGETLITGIGQGFTLATPLQLASATAALARHGLPLRPKILYAISEPNSGVLKVQQAEPLEPIPMTRASYWDQVIQAMIDVVHSARGTARRIDPGDKYRIAGKTGTSQVFAIKQDEKYDKSKVPLELRDHALFIAFAPADEPRIAVAVVVEHGGSGGATASPIAGDILKFYLEDHG